METIRVIRRGDNDSYVPTLCPKYVVLGMISEYSGRMAVEGGDIAESFFTNERPIADIFAKYLSACAVTSDVLPDGVTVIETESGHSHVSSKAMNECINAWYKAAFDDDAFITSANGIRHRMASVALTINDFPEKNSMLYKPQEMNPRYSYIYGAILRYGSADLTLRSANALQKVTLIKQVLEQLDVEWISHKYHLGGAPMLHEISFGPDKKLRVLLDMALAERAVAMHRSSRR